MPHTLSGCNSPFLPGSLESLSATYIRFAPSPDDLAASTQTLTARAVMFAAVIFLGMAVLGEYRSTLRMS